MNRAEIAIRNSPVASCRRAVFILNRWTLRNNEEFRQAYLAEDWKAASALCMVAGTKTTPTQMVFNHLMDATAPDAATI